MLERTFTIRISDLEDSLLPEIKEMTGTSSDAAAIRHLIQTYAELTRRFSDEQANSRKLKGRVVELENAISNFTSAFSDLQKTQIK